MKILIVDDNNTVSLIKESLPETWYTEIVSAKDGDQISNLLQSDTPPHLAVLNCSLPQSNSIEICADLKQRFNNFTYVVFLSDGSIYHLLSGLAAGADKVIQKPLNQEELQQALMVSIKDCNEFKKENSSPIKYDPLTSRQLDILKLVAKGLSNQEIATSMGISVGTVKSHLNQILGKLSVTSRSKASVIAAKLGLL